MELRVRAKLALHAARGENQSRVRGRVKWREKTRSVEARKLPNFSDRERRRASLEAIGANGS